jgi:hypothetical protein
MAASYRRILNTRKLGPSQVQAHDQIWDAGGGRVLEVAWRVVTASGQAANLLIQTAAVNEDDAFVTIITIPLGAVAATTLASTDHFLRYIRWITDANVTSNPVAVVDAIAKE